MKALGYVFKSFHRAGELTVHFIPVASVRELKDFLAHGWSPVIPERIPVILAQLDVLPDERLSAAQGYPVARAAARR